MTDQRTVFDGIAAFLDRNEVDWEPGARDFELVANLPGERKLKTGCSLLVGETDLTTTAFVIRNADENHVEFYRFLLRKNLKLPGLAYGIDGDGDVYVTGRAPLGGVDDDYLDRLLGAVLAAADEVFNELLVIGFFSSMKKEWDWRISRGESTRNLEAFRHLLED